MRKSGQIWQFIIMLVGLCLASGAIGAETAGMSAPGEKHWGSKLSDNIRIQSEILGYDLQYRVYVPPNYRELSEIPVLYIVDGQWYIKPGGMPGVIDSQLAEALIEPIIAVFVDSSDPQNPDNNRRNQEFFCNEKYARFFTQELIPAIDHSYKTLATREGRVILGMSFGGLNAACFALHASDEFGGIAMQSPATHAVDDLFMRFKEIGPQPIKIFLSTGTVRDNYTANHKFAKLLKYLDYEVKYKEVRYTHNWKNWQPLLDDVLRWFYSPDA